MDDDEDNEFRAALYENGHWEWSNLLGSLIFRSDVSSSEDSFVPPPATFIGSLEFREDLDLIEQQRFRKRFQRKVSATDVVTLQDVKDLVLYTAPKAVLTLSLVNVLHLPMTERFLRALITYVQYYLQISDEMRLRLAELETKIRTLKSKDIEVEFRDNLQDLRLLVAKEYCSIIMELEVHRIFKSHIYNMIEHKLQIKYSSEMYPRELLTLLGHCLKPGRMTNISSPLMSEVQCHREVDYRLMGLGTIQYDDLSPRLMFFERVLIDPEATFIENGISMGILGISRNRLDTMLKEIKHLVGKSSSSQNIRQSSNKQTALSPSSTKFKSSILYGGIVIPKKDSTLTMQINESFPTKEMPQKPCNKEQHKKWFEQAKRTKNRHAHYV